MFWKVGLQLEGMKEVAGVMNKSHQGPWPSNVDAADELGYIGGA